MNNSDSICCAYCKVFAITNNFQTACCFRCQKSKGCYHDKDCQREQYRPNPKRRCKNC